MTAAAHARSGGLGRLADLFRGHRRLPDPPDLVAMRWRDFGDGPKITGPDYDTSYGHPGWEHDGRSVIEAIKDSIKNDEEAIERDSGPPWDFAAPVRDLPPGPNSLASLAAATCYQPRRHEEPCDEPHDDTVWDLHANPGLSRPYAPEPEAADMAAPVFRIADDYRSLPVFQAVVRGACRAGLTGIGTRGAFLVPPPPHWGLDRFTADTGSLDDLEPEWDQVAEHAEAGFYRARRMFHSAGTAGFPAVTA